MSTNDQPATVAGDVETLTELLSYAAQLVAELDLLEQRNVPHVSPLAKVIRADRITHMRQNIAALTRAIAALQERDAVARDGERWRLIKPHLYIDGNVDPSTRAPLQTWLAIAHFSIEATSETDAEKVIDAALAARDGATGEAG